MKRRYQYREKKIISIVYSYRICLEKGITISIEVMACRLEGEDKVIESNLVDLVTLCKRVFNAIIHKIFISVFNHISKVNSPIKSTQIHSLKLIDRTK